jgi:hypothetical protein
MKIIASSILFIFLLSCASISKTDKSQLVEAYSIINLEKYGDGVLFYKTVQFSSLYGDQESFNYNFINNHNYNKNWALEAERYIDFDTIFSNAHREKINQKFKNLKSLKLNSYKLNNPQSITKKEVGDYYQAEGLKGYMKITYPFFQKGVDGSLYSFIYRSYYNEGILFIYKYTEKGWVEFAKTPIWIS